MNFLTNGFSNFIPFIKGIIICQQFTFENIDDLAYHSVTRWRKLKVCLKSTKIYLDESIWTFFAYTYETMLFPFLWLIKFSGSLFSIFFLHNFSLLQFHWKKARKMIYYNCMNTAGEKAALLHHEKAALWKLLHHAKHKIHKNNKMHFYKNYNSTLYNTDSPCWIILFPRHLSYHHTTTTTIRPSWHLMFYIFSLETFQDASHIFPNSCRYTLQWIND